MLDNIRTIHDSIVTAVHDDIDAPIWKVVKDSN